LSAFSTNDSTPTDALIGRRVGGCKLLAVVGRGGMGVVYRGHQESLDRAVAVKVIQLSAAAGHGADQRLFKEARAAARLGHPNIVQIFDAGQAHDLAFIVMELVQGRSLGAWLRALGRLTPRETIQIAIGAARGLAAAHAAGIVHRDIKPDNLLVGASAAAKVADFGLTKLAGEAGEITRSGMILGTPMYMSPEGCEGRAVDARSDLYSLGATIFACAAGDGPFSSKTVPGFLLAHVTKPPPRLRSRAEDAPPALDDLVDRLLAKAPDDRPACADEVVLELEAMLAALDDRRPARFTNAPVEPVRAGPGGAEVVGTGTVAAPEAPPLADEQTIRTIVVSRNRPATARPSLEEPTPAARPVLEVDDLLLRARIYFRRGAHEEAARDLGEALERAPSHLEARFALACVLAAAGEGDAALDALERAVADGFQDPERIRRSEPLKPLRRDPRLTAVLRAAEAAEVASSGGGSSQNITA